MNGIYFIFLALATTVMSVTFLKTVLKPETQHDAVAYGVITFLLGGSYAALFYVLTGFNIRDFAALARPEVAILVALDIFVWALSFRIAFPSYKHLPVSETTIFSALEGLFALIFGALLFHTDKFYATRVLGAALILAAIALVSQEKGKWRFNKYTLGLILATILIGLATVLDNVIVARSYFTSIAFFLALNFGIPPLIALALRPKTLGLLPTIYKHRKAMIAVVVTSITSISSFVLVYNAYQRHVVASQSYLILSSQAVVVVLIGALFLKERQRLPLKILAACIAGVGVFLIA